MKGAGYVGGVEAVSQQASVSWHSRAGNDQSCSIWKRVDGKPGLRVLSLHYVRRMVEK